jgi:hypothetical protein
MLGTVGAGGSDGADDDDNTEVGSNGFDVGLLFRNGFVIII